MAYKLKLKNMLSYSGIVSADARNPFVIAKTQEEADEIMETGYFEVVESEAAELPSSEKHTKTSLKKLNAEQQKEVIVLLNGDPSDTNNEDERIDLILKLQDEAGE
ncbi:hypothetical protein [Domibacillus tundrae]|uniref:hypothetical protein n=1 Tax=Domibacillus tundrae TaxID=1587527 RepID=UPI000617EA3E|nr:hypothetical protein [Domibacillus tundrae]